MISDLAREGGVSRWTASRAVTARAAFATDNRMAENALAEIQRPRPRDPGRHVAR
jgi:DNA-binding LacI/PurR family transcriptional regulator